MSDTKIVQTQTCSNKPNKAHIEACASHLRETDYLVKRGISYELADRFKIGYDPDKGRIIIPYAGGYMARATSDEEPVKCLYLPRGTPRGIFNGGALFNRERKPVFIVEGEIDALSLIACGVQAIGIGDAQQFGKIIAMARSNPGSCAPLIPFMDRDAAGESAQHKFEAGLLASGIRFVPGMQRRLIPDAADGSHPKDANEALVRDKDAFYQRVREVAEDATASVQSVGLSKPLSNESTHSGLLLRHFDQIPPVIPETEDADALIKNFTLAKGEGIILAAEPGAGKSTLLTQLALCAAAGKPFFGFEFTHPLRVFYLQTELQERKLRQTMESQTAAFVKFPAWTPDDVKLATAGVTYDCHMIGNV